MRWLLPIGLALLFLRWVAWGDPGPEPISYATSACFIGAAVCWAMK